MFVVLSADINTLGKAFTKSFINTLGKGSTEIQWKLQKIQKYSVQKISSIISSHNKKLMKNNDPNTKP